MKTALGYAALSEGESVSNKKPANLSATVLEDTRLLEQIAKGDRKAFEQLYKKYQPRLINFCARQLNNDVSIAADMADEAMIEVWRSAGSFSGRSTPSTWIHSIARFRLIGYLRKNKEVLLDNDSGKFDLEDTSLSPDEEMMLDDRDELILYTLGKLSDKHKEIIELVYFRELSIKDISTMLNISENTVKTRMFYARKHLKTLLKSNGIHKSHKTYDE